jgi:hypothetical protein
MRCGGIARAGLGAAGAIPRFIERDAAIADRWSDAGADSDSKSGFNCDSDSDIDPSPGARAHPGRGLGRGGRRRRRLRARVGASVGLLGRNRAGRDPECRTGDHRRPCSRRGRVRVRGALLRTSRSHSRLGRGRRRDRYRLDRERAARPARPVVDSRHRDRRGARTLVLTATDPHKFSRREL